MANFYDNYYNVLFESANLTKLENLAMNETTTFFNNCGEEKTMKILALKMRSWWLDVSKLLTTVKDAINLKIRANKKFVAKYQIDDINSIVFNTEYHAGVRDAIIQIGRNLNNTSNESPIDTYILEKDDPTITINAGEEINAETLCSLIFMINAGIDSLDTILTDILGNKSNIEIASSKEDICSFEAAVREKVIEIINNIKKIIEDMTTNDGFVSISETCESADDDSMDEMSGYHFDNARTADARASEFIRRMEAERKAKSQNDNKNETIEDDIVDNEGGSYLNNLDRMAEYRIQQYMAQQKAKKEQSTPKR